MCCADRMCKWVGVIALIRANVHACVSSSKPVQSSVEEQQSEIKHQVQGVWSLCCWIPVETPVPTRDFHVHLRCLPNILGSVGNSCFDHIRLYHKSGGVVTMQRQ